MRAENLEKVLERLTTSEKTTIVIAREQDVKMRVTSGSWDGGKVFWLAIRSSKSATSTVAYTSVEKIDIPTSGTQYEQTHSGGRGPGG